MSDTSSDGWHPVLARDQLGLDDVRGVELAGHDIAVCTVAGEVHAIANGCPHGFARLSDGFLLDHELECPLHQARFDVRTGAVTCGPATAGVACYPARVADGQVWLRLVPLPAG